ncbi:MAG TPA: HAD family phosphatase [Candidatus Levilactobacillus faecigallinarum]|uniref:HAD family phosphatase n=1 Tax=Candidatus Levilactobacillus faecigallinarum TaxID=2838638 RepID=A0A9D1QUL0_9LACO|nr:HAD family phosphatase [Candidatus Levilactobacillus faecigallinarum]
MINTLIFDFNGTMFFDGLLQKNSWREFLEERFGSSMTDHEFGEHVAGRNNRHTFEYFTNRKFTDAELFEIAEQKEQLYREYCLRQPGKFRLVTGLPELLSRCQQEGTKLNIATASERTNVDFFFEHLHLDKWFDIDQIVLNNGELPGKPAPDMFLQAIKNVGATPANSAIFEDSASGIEAANHARVGQVVLVEDSELDKMIIPANLRVDKIIHDYQHLKL